MLVLQTIIFFVLFALLSFGVFYSFGFWVISRFTDDLDDQEVIALSFALGTVLFVLLAVALGLLQLRMLTLPFLIILNGFVVLKFKQRLFTPWRVFLRYKILLVVIIAGIFIQGMINFPSGFLYKEGLLFWSSQGHDGLWHVASMEEIAKVFPPQNPGFSGEPLYNYHYLVDVIMGEFFRIFPMFSSLDLYFRYFPVLFSFMIGMSVFAFVARWQNNKKVGLLALFFIYSVGSFGYVVNFTKGGSIFGGETIFWAAQQNTILGNPPHAISHAILPAFLLSALHFFKSRSKGWFITAFLTGSVLAGFKVSGGLVMLVGLGSAAVGELVFNRRFSTLMLAGALGLSNLITIKSMASGAGSFLVFLPWWFVRTTIVDRISWMDLEFQRQHYLSKGTWNASLRVLQVEMIAFAIFLIGNMGTRILGFFEIIQKVIMKRREIVKDQIEILLLGSMLTGLVVPILFVQKGLIYNNIQFMQYFLLISGFYAAVAIYRLLVFFRRRVIQVIVMLLIFALSVPTVIGNLVEFYGPNASPLSMVSRQQIEALNYVKDHTNPGEVILNVPFNRDLKNKFRDQPKPIYAWYDTPYISALTGRRSYLASEHVTLLEYPDTKKRQENMKKFFLQTDLNWNRQFLKDASISYIYINKPEIKSSLNMGKNNLSPFYENSEVIIYKVN